MQMESLLGQLVHQTEQKIQLKLLLAVQSQKKYGSAVSSWEGSNISVAASAGIAGGDAVFTVNDATADWSLSVTTRAAGALTEQYTE